MGICFSDLVATGLHLMGVCLQLSLRPAFPPSCARAPCTLPSVVEEPYRASRQEETGRGPYLLLLPAPLLSIQD